MFYFLFQQMALRTRTKYQDIPFVIDGVAKIVKSVTSQTTCGDVINKLPKLSTPLAVFASVDGIEKELSSKTKLLKVWRAHTSSQKVVFVVRRSEKDSKLKKSNSRLFGDRPRCEQQSMISYQDRTKDKLRQFSSFIKEKKQRINRRFSEGPSFLHSTLKPKKSSTNMALESTRLSAVLDKSASSSCGHRTISRQSSRILNVKPRDPLTVMNALNTKKLGLKTRFQTCNISSNERKSKGSLRSADTGYSSVDARPTTHNSKRYQTQLLDDTEDGPRHSTPVVQHTRKRRCSQLDTTVNEEFEELRGKSMILKKFMEDQLVYGATTEEHCDADQETVENKRRRTDFRLSLPAFTTQEEKCRYLWNQYCDSESDCSEDSFMNNSTMDRGFLESFDLGSTYMEKLFTKQRRNKLRRDSAISNLTKFSLQRKEAEIPEEDNIYDYSFDCSFQRMDESQVIEFGADFHEQFDTKHDDSDCSVDSFMKTRSDLDDADNVINKKTDDSITESDEGIGSSSGGSVANGQVHVA